MNYDVRDQEAEAAAALVKLNHEFLSRITSYIQTAAIILSLLTAAAGLNFQIHILPNCPI
jgi:hypothetical protein